MEAVLSDKECGYYMKLITFILEIGMDVLHTYFEQNILNAKEHLEFYMFLDKNKHNLYHECYPKVECCECSQNGLGMASQKGCLTKQQFLLLFEIGALTETDHYETGRRINEISKQCLCRIIAKRSNDVDCMDITLMYAIIQSCYLKHNIAIHGNPRCIEAIKDTRNFLAHLPNPRISKSEYDTRFAETEQAILEIGSSLGNYFAKRNQKKIDEFKRNDLSIEGIKKIIENNIDEIIKKKLQSLMKDQIKSTMMEFKEEWKIEVQNLTFQVLKDAMASCSIKKTSDSSGPQKNATACGVNVEETEEGNINVKKRRVEWKLLTPSTWNLPDIIDTLKKRSARLRQWFEIENVFEGSLVIQTLVQQNVLDNREEFRASVHLFLEKFVEVCRINADVPTVIEVALIIELGEFEKEETEEQPSNIEMKKKDETTCIAYNIHCQKCRQKDEIIDSLISLKEELYENRKESSEVSLESVVSEMDKDSPEIKSLKSESVSIENLLDGVTAVPGSSLGNTTLSSIMPRNYHVVFGIEVENLTKYKLENSETYLTSGEISIPASDIRPGYKEAMVATKKPYWPAFGICGIVSWLISGCNRRLVIMFTLPWPAFLNYLEYTNKLSVGISDVGITEHDSKWHKAMKKLYNTYPGLNFKTEEYINSTRPVKVADETFQVSGIMGTGHQIEAKVVFKPNHVDNLAQNLKQTVLKSQSYMRLI